MAPEPTTLHPRITPKCSLPVCRPRGEGSNEALGCAAEVCVECVCCVCVCVCVVVVGAGSAGARGTGSGARRPRGADQQVEAGQEDDKQEGPADVEVRDVVVPHLEGEDAANLLEDGADVDPELCGVVGETGMSGGEEDGRTSAACALGRRP